MLISFYILNEPSLNLGENGIAVLYLELDHGKRVFDTPGILQVFPLINNGEVCYFHYRDTSVRDKIMWVFSYFLFYCMTFDHPETSNTSGSQTCSLVFKKPSSPPHVSTRYLYKRTPVHTIRLQPLYHEETKELSRTPGTNM